MKLTILAFAAGIILPLFATSCSTTAGNVAAGAATVAAVDHYQDEQRKEDYRDAKYYQKQKNKKNR